MMAYDPSADHSSLRESILEHTFLGALGRELWARGRYSVEVLRAEVDRAGYDVVITVDDQTRYIQLKAFPPGRLRGNGPYPNSLHGSREAALSSSVSTATPWISSSTFSSAAIPARGCPTSQKRSKPNA